MSSSDNNPFTGFFTGMMNQFMRDSMANGSLLLPWQQIPALPLALQLPFPPFPSHLPSPAPAGHPLPSNNLLGCNSTQSMLGMGGLGIPVSGHSNHPRRRRHVGELSPTQISETSVTHCAAAREHLGPTGAALQLRSCRVHGPAVRGAVLNEAPGTTLEQAFQPGQEVTYYKNHASAFGQFARDSYLLFESTVAESTKVTTLLEMPTVSMRTGLWHYNFGSLPPGPSTRLRHEQLHLQALAFVNSF
ncbi:hypothetical protein B0H19DRAFT_1063445 [Mycena capillaripes]|nr:hypothetical protein B0H19DRAFT_1063445 [Mycena capillaripes]